MAILVFAGVLSIPSAVFAEASWYGSLRAGLEFSDSNTKVVDIASRWGIKGSAEAGEGLTATYRFEHKISTENAGMPGGRLASVGLSGGFGSVTAGQIWSATYNSVGAITDNSWWTGESHTSGRHGNVLSYAFSNDLMALQVDAMYGAPVMHDPKANDLQKSEFGLSVNIGEIGKVAFAHSTKNFVFDEGATEETAVDGDDSGWKVKANTIAGQISVAGMRVYAGSQTEKSDFIALTNGANGLANKEQKVTFFGSGGSLGDTGISYLFQWRDIKDSHKPWMLGLYKSLGGGASINFEHANNDDNSEDASYIFLAVGF